MLKFEWNALRAGDKVLVHDPRHAEKVLSNGVVALIDSHKGAANGVGIRVTDTDGERVILWPSFLAVHSDPRDVGERCLRCEALSPAPAG